MKDHLSRRQFLFRSAGIAGASVAGAASVASGGRGRSLASDAGARELGVGFIGLGDRGRHLLGSLLRVSSGPEGVRPRVVALADPNPRSLRKALEIVAAAEPEPRGATLPRCFDDGRRILEDGAVEAVFIATPVDLHAPQAVAALASGRHVYCEKPLAGSVEACRQVLAAAWQARQGPARIFQVGLQRRYSPRYGSSVRLVHDGEAGSVLFVRAQWHAAAPPRADKPWIFRRDRSGDIVVEQACHQFDVFNWLFRSPPVRACALGGGAEVPFRDVLDRYGAVLEYPHGVQVHLSHLSCAVPDRRFSGIYELVFGEKAGVDLGGAMVWTPAGEMRRLAAEGGSDTELAVAAFLRSVATGEPPVASAEVGYLATMAALLCRKAMDEGRMVAWGEIEPDAVAGEAPTRRTRDAATGETCAPEGRPCVSPG